MKVTLKTLYRRLFRGMTCAHWPCRRCDRAGRSSWRSRKAWHSATRIRRVLSTLAGAR